MGGASCLWLVLPGSLPGEQDDPATLIFLLLTKPDISSRSIATAFAPNDKAFIIFIALKGLGAAANTPSGIGLLSSYFPPGPKRNKAFGALGAGQPLGFIGGLILGAVKCLVG